MTERIPARSSARISFNQLVVLVGGFLGFVGVFYRWFQYSLPVSGGTVSVYETGLTDVSGWLAAAAALVTFSAAALAMLSKDDGIGRTASVVAGIAGGFVAGFSVVGLVRAPDLGAGLPGAIGDGPALTGTAGIGLYVSFLGGAVATIAAAIAIRRRPPTTRE